MYDVKLVKDGVVIGVYPVSHIEATPFPSLNAPVRDHRDPETNLPLFTPDDIGIEIECCGCPVDRFDLESPNVTIRIPRDGDAVFVSELDETGTARTVHSYRVDSHGTILSGFTKKANGERPTTPTRGRFGRTVVGE